MEGWIDGAQRVWGQRLFSYDTIMVDTCHHPPVKPIECTTLTGIQVRLWTHGQRSYLVHRPTSSIGIWWSHCEGILKHSLCTTVPGFLTQQVWKGPENVHFLPIPRWHWCLLLVPASLFGLRGGKIPWLTLSHSPQIVGREASWTIMEADAGRDDCQVAGNTSVQVVRGSCSEESMWCSHKEGVLRTDGGVHVHCSTVCNSQDVEAI